MNNKKETEALKMFFSDEEIFHQSNDSKNKSLQQLLDIAFNKLTVEQKQTEFPNHFWSEKRYGFERSSKYMKLNPEEKNKALRYLTEQNLALSYFIEKSGHNYGAKMILLAKNQDEKFLYSLFAAEEAVHQREFMNHMWFTPNANDHWHPMLNVLGEVMREGERNTLIYVVQVLLEGFGMSFYSGLGDTCDYAPMKNVYARILQDEARHHGSGVILANFYDVNKYEKEQIFEFTKKFITALQSASWFIKALENSNGPMSEQEKKIFLSDINYEETLSNRRKRLKDMLTKVDSWGLIGMLEKDKVI
ncbi:MAG: ferritin-like domain-containing protein [Bacteriovorax sp.]|nr:ferritin-like domain-containing protein [Bacteriovorax sp.]